MEDQLPPLPESFSSRSAIALRDLEMRAQAALASKRDHMAHLEAELTRQLDHIAASLQEQQNLEGQQAEEVGKLRAEVERLTSELETQRELWQAERAELQAERDELARQFDASETARLELAEKVAATEAQQLESEERWQQRATELEQQMAERKTAAEEQLMELQEHVAAIQRERDELTERLTSLQAVRDGGVEEAAKLEAAHHAVQQQWQQRLTELEEKLAQQQSEWDEQRRELASQFEAAKGERDEFQQKFELALEDVQRFRAHVAELEQELASRPQSGEADSTELVALRAERNALADRVEQLERQVSAQVDAGSEQQVADLQRRFELAVEDVRELKTKNADLEAKLAAASKVGAPRVESAGSDWESLKRRLLASLEDEGEDGELEPERLQERASIENTIQITDAVVAAKEHELEALRAQLAAAEAVPVAAADEARNRQITELLDADEVIAEHRQRVAQLEKEMEEKLRATELELSVERAKMARQKAELEDLRAELESKNQGIEGGNGGGGVGAPRRRWLSKLGLSGEE